MKNLFLRISTYLLASALMLTVMVRPLLAADKGAPAPAAAVTDDGPPVTYTVWKGMYLDGSIGGKFLPASGDGTTLANVTSNVGIGLGYDWQYEHQVFGPFVRGTFGDGVANVQAGWRHGWAVNQFILPYAWTSFDSSTTNFNIQNTAWALGLGAEVRLAEHMTGFAEFGKDVAQFGALSGTPNADIFRVGLRYKW